MRQSQDEVRALVMMQIREGEDNSELARQLARTCRPPCWRQPPICLPRPSEGSGRSYRLQSAA